MRALILAIGLVCGSALQRDPHVIDVTVRIGALAASALALGLFAAGIPSPAIAVASVGFYFAATAAAYASQTYSIYYTSDYLMIAAWFWAAYLLDTDRLAPTALAVFAGAWAKETLLLAPILVGFQWLRRREDLDRLLLVTAGICHTDSRAPFIRDLALTCGVYLILAYIVVYIRELRHFLPLAILSLPLSLREIAP